MGEQIENPEMEPWLSKKSVAKHYDFSMRWVEDKMRQGVPRRRIGNQPRFRISEIDPWLEAHAAEAAEV